MVLAACIDCVTMLIPSEDVTGPEKLDPDNVATTLLLIESEATPPESVRINPEDPETEKTRSFDNEPVADKTKKEAAVSPPEPLVILTQDGTLVSTRHQIALSAVWYASL